MKKMGFLILTLAAFLLVSCNNPASSSNNTSNNGNTTTTLTAASFAGTYIGQAAYDGASMNPPYKIVIDSTGLVWTTYDKSVSPSSASPTVYSYGVYAANTSWFQLLVGAQYWVLNLTGTTLSVKYVNYTGGSFTSAYASTAYTYTKQ